MNRDFLALPSQDIRKNVVITRLLQNIHTAQRTIQFASNQYPFEAGDFFYFKDYSDNSCQVVAVEGTHGLALFANGTDGRLTHKLNLIEGYIGLGQGLAGSGANVAFVREANEILNWIPPNINHDTTRLYLFGHSYGAGGLMAIAHRAILLATGQGVSCITYGIPRYGSILACRFMARREFVRWYCSDDAVRWLPPHADEVPSLYAVLDSDLTRGMDLTCAVPWGYGLYPNGRVLQDEGEPGRTHAVALSLLAYMGGNGFGSYTHSIDEYSRRFQLAELALPGIPKRIDTNVPTEQPLVLNAAAERHWRNEGVADINTGVTTNTLPPTDFTVAPPGTARTVRYRRRKRGRIWTVEYAGVVVAIGPGKRRAGVIARRLNRTRAVPVPLR